MEKKDLISAINELRQLSEDTARLHGGFPVGILVYATAFELKQKMTLEQAQAVLAQAWQEVQNESA